MMILTWLSARRGGPALLAVALLALAAPAAAQTTGPFQGVKVNGGTVSHSLEGGTHYLTLSDDFVSPEAPDPHWQLIDTRGRTFLMQRVMIKDGGYNRRIAVPAYVGDVARVQMWCAWAETVLGEASFPQPVAMVRSR